MLRTMVGLGLVLILVLSYAVYTATIDSEYYRYETTNESVDYQLQLENENESSWYTATTSSPTWVNITVTNAPNNAELIVTSTSSTWYHSPLLGEDGDSIFNCKEFDEISDSCDEAYEHNMMIDSQEVVMRGRSSLYLPIEGVGYERAVNQSQAELEILELISQERVTTTWIVGIYVDGELVSPEGILVSFSLTEHELVSVSEFKIDPVQETLYGIATLVGCFFLLIAVPMMVYFAGIAKARLDEENRLDDPAPSE